MWNLDKHTLKFGYLQFEIWTNTIQHIDKYNVKFEHVQFEIWTSTIWNLDLPTPSRSLKAPVLTMQRHLFTVILSIWTNTNLFRLADAPQKPQSLFVYHAPAVKSDILKEINTSARINSESKEKPMQMQGKYKDPIHIKGSCKVLITEFRLVCVNFSYKNPDFTRNVNWKVSYPKWRILDLKVSSFSF